MDNVKKVPQRDGYGLGLLELCEARSDVLVLDADVSASTRTNSAQKALKIRQLCISSAKRNRRFRASLIIQIPTR